MHIDCQSSTALRVAVRRAVRIEEKECYAR